MFSTKILAQENLERAYQLGDYSLLELIGRGGEGVVWSAWDNHRQRVVALKVLSSLGEDPMMANVSSRDFERQVHLLASLDHPNILPLYEFGTSAANYFFVMRYNCAGTLASRLLGGPLPLVEALRVAAQMAAALAYLHSRSIVHRDLKPTNVLLDSQDWVLLSDFGLARQLSQETMPFHTGRGTGPYAPYEQHVHFGMSPQSDIYSMGVVIYEMLTGHLPWDGGAFLAIQQKQEGLKLPDLRESDPTLPAALTAVLRKLTAFNYRDRPATAVDAINLILDAVPDLPPQVLAYCRTPLPIVSDELLVTQDAQFLLNMFLTDWEGAAEEFPARLTHLAFIDAAAGRSGRYQLKLNEAQTHFMLRGALAHDYHVDYWWRQVADAARRVQVCAETIAHEGDTAVSQAISRLADEVNQPDEAVQLSPETQAMLIDMALGSRGWALRQNALKVLIQTAPEAARWQPVAFTATGDVRLAEIALSDSLHAEQAAALIGHVRSETAVQTILLNTQTDRQKLLETLQQVQSVAGSLPGLVPLQIRLSVKTRWWRERLFENRDEMPLPRALLGLMAGALVAVLMVLGLFSVPAAQMRDVLLAPYPVSGLVTIVEVDDASLARYGRWDAWSRSLHADLIERLVDAGARAIALDIMFDSPSADAAADGRLADVMRKAGIVVQPVLGQGDGLHDVPGAVRFEGRILPYDALLAASAAVGHTNILHDEDGYVRRIPTVMAVNEERHLSLPLAALLVFLQGGALPDEVVPGPQNGLLTVAGRQIPVGPLGEMSIYYAGPPADTEQQSFTMVSYQDVLDGRVPPELLEGKIVLVGITATSEPDSYLTPVSHGRPMYGVEILANSIESIWSEHFIVRPSLFWQIILLLVLGVLTGLVCARAWSGLLLAAGLGLLYIIFATLLFETRSIMLDLLYPFLAIALSYAFVTAYHLSVEVRRRREMMQLFATNMTPEIARATIDAVKKGEINLGGQVQEISVLCVDIRGYRSLAEWYEPGMVMTMMNELGELIRGMMLEFEGTITQHEGEQVMAMYNAPLPQADHAWRSVETAVTIRDRLSGHLASLPADHPLQAVKFGYGVFSGRAIVGNAGTALRTTYTAVGETVNLASQLAGQATPGQIWLGEPTYEKVAEWVVGEPLPPILVKDRSTALPLFAVAGPASLVK